LREQFSFDASAIIGANFESSFKCRDESNVNPRPVAIGAAVKKVPQSQAFCAPVRDR
jgi:hypothetical protein